MQNPSSFHTFMASPAIRYSSLARPSSVLSHRVALRLSALPSTNSFRVMINTSEAERHKDDIADGIEARMRMQTSDKTGGIIFFGLNQSPE